MLNRVKSQSFEQLCNFGSESLLFSPLMELRKRMRSQHSPPLSKIGNGFNVSVLYNMRPLRWVFAFCMCMMRGHWCLINIFKISVVTETGLKLKIPSKTGKKEPCHWFELSPFQQLTTFVYNRKIGSVATSLF